jgi:hypothetical protein
VRALQRVEGERGRGGQEVDGIFYTITQPFQSLSTTNHVKGSEVNIELLSISLSASRGTYLSKIIEIDEVNHPSTIPPCHFSTYNHSVLPSETNY